MHFLLWVCCKGGRCVRAHLCACACEGQSKCKAPGLSASEAPVEIRGLCSITYSMCVSKTQRKSVCMRVYAVCVCVCVCVYFMAVLERNLKRQPPEIWRCMWISGPNMRKSFNTSLTKKVTSRGRIVSESRSFILLPCLHEQRVNTGRSERSNDSTGFYL